MSMEALITHFSNLNIPREEYVVVISQNRYLIYTQSGSVFEYKVDENGNYVFNKIDSNQE